VSWIAPAILILIGALNFFSARKRGAMWFSIGAAGIVLCGVIGIVVTFWRSLPLVGILGAVLILSLAATVTGFVRHEFKPLT
jgi:hypothetical protein